MHWIDLYGTTSPSAVPLPFKTSSDLPSSAKNFLGGIMKLSSGGPRLLLGSSMLDGAAAAVDADAATSAAGL